MPRKVAVLAYEGLSPFELGIVVEVFGLARPELPVEWYDLVVCAERAGPLSAVGGFTLTAAHGLEALVTADIAIVPGCTDVDADPSPAVTAALRAAHARGARVVSVCSGAFVLAAAGLLDGREAATHWRYAERLAHRYPRVRVNRDVLYVDDGDVLTSAGSAAGIDLCLHLVRGDHGAGIATAVARRMVVAPHREGGQAQFVEAPLPATDPDGDLRALLEALPAELAAPLPVARLAARVHMSERTFLRRFAAATGTSPARWLLQQRLLRARELLERTDLPVERVAREAGLGSPENLRHHFRRSLGTSPQAYRRTFRD
jgi:transcriptional regulator GlxA family with amidase domain